MAINNRTLKLVKGDKSRYSRVLKRMEEECRNGEYSDKLLNMDIMNGMSFLPDCFVDLLFIDPPYNLSKKFNTVEFRKRDSSEYRIWMEGWLAPMIRLLKPNASIYICGDWRTSSIIHEVCEKNFHIINRITFERDKGRGSKRNWKNNSEDIWFCSMSKHYFFNPEPVKIKRRVLAPYKVNGKPKDWKYEQDGEFRETMPSNIWTDITIPFWSMPENTPHPTQKPEKLLAKTILASSREGDVVFDPFSGSGTTGVVAKKLNRKFLMVELDKEYCCFALKRLENADRDRTIQGYADGIFWERNALRH